MNLMAFHKTVIHFFRDLTFCFLINIAFSILFYSYIPQINFHIVCMQRGVRRNYNTKKKEIIFSFKKLHH